MKKFLLSILSIFILFSCFITPIHADSGPKPSVTINFEGINEEYYVTLLSDKMQYGPNRKQDEFDSNWSVRKSIWEAFNNYEDEFYFIGYFEECTISNEFHWGYFPPDSFKVLVYLPNSNTFIESEIMEKYAFDSYYDVIVNDHDLSIKINLSYNIIKESISFVARLVLTIAIELLFAYIFSLTKKEHTKIIVLTNIITQVFLNIGLNIVILLWGYVFLEAMIIVIEGLSYKYLMKDVKRSTIWLYAVIANILSFLFGVMISASFPALF